MFNSAKNKYDPDEEFESGNYIQTNTNNIYEIKIKANSDNSDNNFNENESCDTAISNAIISRDSNSSNNSNSQNIIFQTTQLNNFTMFKKNNNIKGFLGDNKIPDVKKIYKDNEPKDLLTLHIKQALRQMEKDYCSKIMNGNNNLHRNKYNYCEYFFSSSVNKIWENNDENF